jgi:hypothetical protein
MEENNLYLVELEGLSLPQTVLYIGGGLMFKLPMQIPLKWKVKEIIRNVTPTQ